jgi:hypothetical protein
MLGIIVHGSNHFIVRGPLPSRTCARRLVRNWEFVQTIGHNPRVEPDLWRISTREFRENLEWAVWLEGEEQAQPAVLHLLEELRARGVAIHRAAGPFLPDSGDTWPGEDCR